MHSVFHNLQMFAPPPSFRQKALDHVICQYCYCKSFLVFRPGV